MADEEMQGIDAPEMFPMGEVEGGPKSLKNLIPAGAKVKSTVSIKSAEVPAREGIFDPAKRGKLLVEFELDSVQTVPHREEGKVTDYTVRQVLAPTYVERVDADTGDIEAQFELVLDDDPQAAGKLLDKLQRRAKKALQPA